MSRPMYSRFSIVLSVALLLSLWLEHPRHAAWAHAYPAVSIPNDGATVKEPPREMRIQFTEAVELAFSHITVKGAKGEVVSQGKLRQLANDTVAIDLKPLQPPETITSNGRSFPSTPILPTACCILLSPLRSSRNAMLALEATVSAISYIALAVVSRPTRRRRLFIAARPSRRHCAGRCWFGQEPRCCSFSARHGSLCCSRRKLQQRLSFSRIPLALSDDDPERQDLVCTRNLRRSLMLLGIWLLPKKYAAATDSVSLAVLALPLVAAAV